MDLCVILIYNRLGLYLGLVGLVLLDYMIFWYSFLEGPP